MIHHDDCLAPSPPQQQIAGGRERGEPTPTAAAELSCPGAVYPPPRPVAAAVQFGEVYQYIPPRPVGGHHMNYWKYRLGGDWNRYKYRLPQTGS